MVPPPTGAMLRVPSDANALDAIRVSWPPRQVDPRTGYMPLSLGDMVPLDIMVMSAGAANGNGDGSRHAVAVAADVAGRHAGVPLTRMDRDWQLATAGDGTTAALLDALRNIDGSPSMAQPRGFFLQRLGELPSEPSTERGLATDQTNQSVVVDESVIVKWHTAAGVNSPRSTELRRHLAANGFAGGAPLLGVLRWYGAGGDEFVVADIDGYLPGAVDGWDLAIAALVERVDADHGGAMMADGLGATLGAMTAGMHAAAARPSSLVPEPRATAARTHIGAWRSAARLALDEAVAIDASDQDTVAQCARALEASMESLSAVEQATVIPTHGDLHLGQVVGWDGGLAFIDFDGPPTPRGSGYPGLEPATRDVAQMLCSLDQLAVVVDRRTDSRATPWLRSWAQTANHAFLGAYRAGLGAAAADDLLDDRLLAPFIAEQYCRELIYAAQVLPRWRYAPLGAMTWRYSSPSP